jgi:hypothetical protein
MEGLKILCLKASYPAVTDFCFHLTFEALELYFTLDSIFKVAHYYYVQIELCSYIYMLNALSLNGSEDLVQNLVI